MKPESVTDASLREFLLGKLAEEDRERIEDLFLTDSQMRERLLVLEQDLIDDYLEDNLSPGDKERFLSRYAQSDEQRRKLRINRAIKDWAVSEAKVPVPAVVPQSLWLRIWTWLRLRPRFVFPLAAAIVIGVVLAIVWLNSRTDQREYLAIEQQLAQLNSPASLNQVPPQMTSFELRPVSVRSVEPQTELRMPAGVRVVELHLPWIQAERYSTYQASVRRVGERETFTIPNLPAVSDDRYTIRLRLPAEWLTAGQYQVNLSGNVPNGFASLSEEYSFIVTR
jgi:hypothetical protein